MLRHEPLARALLYSDKLVLLLRLSYFSSRYYRTLHLAFGNSTDYLLNDLIDSIISSIILNKLHLE